MEISSVINVIIQTILLYPVFFGVAIGLPILAILWVLFSKNKNWAHTKKPAFWLALIAGIVAFFGLPPFFKSSLSDISYLTDWLFHGACVIGAMIYVFLVTWFFLAPSRF